MFFRLVFLVTLFCLVYGDTNKIGKQNNVLSTTPGSNPPKINDKDYWDIDDFVPYKEDRHDTFDWKLFKEVLLNEQSNVVVSPFSVKLVLTLLSEAAGIESKTLQELNSVFPHVKNKLLVQDIVKNYLRSINEPSEYYTLKTASKLFFDNRFEPKQRYAAKIKTIYNTDIERLDFTEAKVASDAINEWTGNVTNGHIKDIVDPEIVKSSVILIINALFFEGLWRSPFSNETYHNPFFKTATDQVKAEYMTQQDDFYFFDSTKLNAKIIRLPYRGKKISMTIVMPNAVGAINSLIQELEGDGLKRLQWLMDDVPVKLTLPKFKINCLTNLKPILQKLGIQEIFTDSASLPGIDRGAEIASQLKVSNIVQKAGLIVDEKGSTAYAATRVEIVNKFGDDKVNEFLVNRPFVFFIEDETTGSILFFGKVIDPTV